MTTIEKGNMAAIAAACDTINGLTGSNTNLRVAPYLTTRCEIINTIDGEDRIMFSGGPTQGFWWIKGFLDALGHTGHLTY